MISYTDVVSIEMSSGLVVTEVKVNLAAPALVGDSPMDVRGELAADFVIKNEDVKRFRIALNGRGLVRVSIFLSMTSIFISFTTG